MLEKEVGLENFQGLFQLGNKSMFYVLTSADSRLDEVIKKAWKQTQYCLDNQPFVTEDIKIKVF